jgi:hypothetical protein
LFDVQEGAHLASKSGAAQAPVPVPVTATSAPFKPPDHGAHSTNDGKRAAETWDPCASSIDWLGTIDVEKEAATAYDKAAIAMIGPDCPKFKLPGGLEVAAAQERLVQPTGHSSAQLSQVVLATCDDSARKPAAAADGAVVAVAAASSGQSAQPHLPGTQEPEVQVPPVVQLQYAMAVTDVLKEPAAAAGACGVVAALAHMDPPSTPERPQQPGAEAAD